MKYLDLTLPAPQENLACDEALLDSCEEGAHEEILRLWEPDRYFVVAGYSNKTQSEVLAGNCEREGIPILRRCSGGGTVLQGPGCLNYSLIFCIPESGPLSGLTQTNQYIMDGQRRALESLTGRKFEVKGTTDLVSGNKKFSGNAQRRKRKALLFHGTFLCDFDLKMIERTLASPSRQPEYRHGRSHSDFLTNLDVTAEEIKKALRQFWKADEPLKVVPHERIKKLAEEKYSQDSWNFKF